MGNKPKNTFFCEARRHRPWMSGISLYQSHIYPKSFINFILNDHECKILSHDRSDDKNALYS